MSSSWLQLQLSRCWETFFPSVCQLCDAPASPAWEHLVCDSCMTGWPEAPAGCPRCGQPDAATEHPCIRCQLQPPAFDRASSAFLYQARVRDAVFAFKFNRAYAVASLLGSQLHPRMPADMTASSYDLITTVPLHWRRQVSRGYNQADLLAEPLARAMKRPVKRLLYRARATQKQSSLGMSERAENSLSAFAVRPGTAVAGARVLLVDDVLTTGATVHACAAALKQAGCQSVDVFTLARTP